MYAAKRFLAGIVLLMLAVNAVDAREGNPYSDQLKSSGHEPIAKEPGSDEYELMTPRLDLSIAPLIDIEYINTWHAAAGNSEKVFVGIEITQLGTDIMGLDNTNFKVEPLFVPAYGPGVRISSVEEITDAVHFYVLEMSPEQICKSVDYPPKAPAPCKQLTWMPGDYSLKLCYITDGKELADTLIDFTI
ncbi:MAG: hypothetical protein ACYDHX_12760 [Methanothrix sp.]